MNCDDFSKGQIVFSKKGRDKGGAFIVCDFDSDYVWLVDGKIRKLNKPKKKKKIHIQITKNVDADIQQRLENNLQLLDADLRKALAGYSNS